MVWLNVWSNEGAKKKGTGIWRWSSEDERRREFKLDRAYIHVWPSTLVSFWSMFWLETTRVCASDILDTVRRAAYDRTAQRRWESTRIWNSRSCMFEYSLTSNSCELLVHVLMKSNESGEYIRYTRRAHACINGSSAVDETRREFKLFPLLCLSSLTSNSCQLLVHVLMRSNESILATRIAHASTIQWWRDSTRI